MINMFTDSVRKAPPPRPLQKHLICFDMDNCKYMYDKHDVIRPNLYELVFNITHLLVFLYSNVMKE